jgi:beta-lactamase class D
MLRCFALLLLLPAFVHAQIDSSRLRATFDAHGYRGAFVLASLDGTTEIRIHEERCVARYIPASTFKIPNSLISLHYGAVRGIHDTLRWDGRKHRIASWEQDQDMSVAFQRSCVWFYQELARRVGAARMARVLEDIRYGNMSIDGGIDRFWLDGALRISPVEQIAFLRALFTSTLPFRPEVMETVRELMVLERTPSTVLRGKTGWGVIDNVNYGWLVGAVEHNGQTWLYATLLIDPVGKSSFPEDRYTVTKALLRETGLLPSP